MKRTIFSLFAVAFLAACGGSTGPGSQISLSFSGGASVSSPNLDLFSAAPPLTDGTNTLTIMTAEIVLRRIKLRRQEVVNCDVDPEPAGCEEFVVGSQLISLPTDGSVTKTISVEIDPGTYNEIEFEVHKVSNDDPEDADFRRDHSEHVGLSIMVVGTFGATGTTPDPFTYTTDLNEKQEIVLTGSDVLVITESGASENVTIVLNLDEWFRDAQGNLIDPESANKGGDNENLVKDNIKGSIDAFRDDDSDGKRG